MSATPLCVHCLGPLRPPGLWSSAWQCTDHGGCHPFFDVLAPSPAALERLRSSAKVPIWLPTPLPPNWFVSALGWAGDERTGARATAIGCAGPAPLGGPAEVVFVAEEPGVGLAARLAGLRSSTLLAGDGPGEAKISAAGHPAPLWALPGDDPDRRGYAGEAKGIWLSLVFWPASASLMLLEDLLLTDLRELGTEIACQSLVFGAPSGRLSAQQMHAANHAAPAGASPAAEEGP